MKRLTLALACLWLVVHCQARTITVDDDGLADFNNIEAAINDANDGGGLTPTLPLFEPGTYTLEVYEDWGGLIGSTTITIN